MKNRIALILFLLVIGACKTNNYLPGLNFELFKGTPVWMLAKYAQEEDTIAMKNIMRSNSINLDFHEPKFGNTLLATAIGNNKKASAKILLEFGANPNERCRYSDATPLIFACENYSGTCDTSAIKMLINYHADVNVIQDIDRIEDNGAHSRSKNTPLMIAATENCLDIVNLLLNSGANINEYTYYEGYGAITSALIQDNLKIAKFLITDKRAKIPSICFIRDKGDSTEQRLSIIDMLNERHYSMDDSNYVYKRQIVYYLNHK